MEHNPPPVPPDLRKNLVFFNKGKHVIHITHIVFQSDIHPRLWDSVGRKENLRAGQIYILPICGGGEVLLRWKSSEGEEADAFKVLFDTDGNPYPYIFGGDKWTMALRHAALKAIRDSNGTD